MSRFVKNPRNFCVQFCYTLFDFLNDSEIRQTRKECYMLWVYTMYEIQFTVYSLIPTVYDILLNEA